MSARVLEFVEGFFELGSRPGVFMLALLGLIVLVGGWMASPPAAHGSDLPEHPITAPLLLAQKLALQTASNEEQAAHKRVQILIDETCKDRLKIEDIQLKQCRIAQDLSTVSIEPDVPRETKP